MIRFMRLSAMKRCMYFLLLLLGAACDFGESQRTKEAFDERWKESFSALQRLESSFSCEAQSQSYTVLYPAYYAGAYVDKDGWLCVRVLTESLTGEQQADLKQRIGETPFRTESCPCPWNYQMAMWKRLDSLWPVPTAKALKDSTKWEFFDYRWPQGKQYPCITIGLGDTNAVYLDYFKRNILDYPRTRYFETLSAEEKAKGYTRDGIPIAIADVCCKHLKL